MEECKPMSIPVATRIKLDTSSNFQLANDTNYRWLIGSLLYLTISRPYIAYAMNLMARFMQNPYV